jgi:hypothetical protein
VDEDSVELDTETRNTNTPDLAAPALCHLDLAHQAANPISQVGLWEQLWNNSPNVVERAFSRMATGKARASPNDVEG